MDWDKLRIFHEAARAGSFTHAGDILNLSQSAISRQVAALEQEVGTALFHRHARGLLLTEQGEVLFRAARDVTDRIQSAEVRLSETNQRPSGVLKVTATVGLGSTWLASRLPEFVERYPEIQIDLNLNDTELDIGMREADVAIRLRQPTQVDLIQRRLFTVHFHLYASPNYVKRFGSPLSIRDLSEHRLVAFGEATASYLRDMNWLDKVMGEQEGVSKVSIKANNIMAMMRAVQADAGIAMLPDYIVDANSGLVRLHIDADLPFFDTYLAYAPELKNTARLAVFRDFLIGQAAQWKY